MKWSTLGVYQQLGKVDTEAGNIVFFFFFLFFEWKERKKERDDNVM